MRQRRRIVAFLIIAVFLLQSIFSNVGMSVSATEITPGISGPISTDPGVPEPSEPIVPQTPALQLSPVGQNNYNYSSVAGPVVEVKIEGETLCVRTPNGEIDGEITYEYTLVNTSDEASLKSAIEVSCKDSNDVSVATEVVNVSYADGIYTAYVKLPENSEDGTYNITVSAYNETGLVSGAPASVEVLIDSKAPDITDVALASGHTVEGLDYPVYNAQALPTVTFKVTEDNLEALLVNIVDANNMPVATLDLNSGVIFDESLQTYSFTIPEGEQLGFVIQALDTANNDDLYQYDGTKVIVDYTDAVMSDLAVSDANVLDNIYYITDSSKVSFSVSDAHYMKSRMSVALYDANNALVSNLDLGTFTETVMGNTYTYSKDIDLADEGAYYYQVVYSDLSRIGAAETSVSRNSGLVKKDASLPTLSLEPNAENNAITTENVSVKIVFNETNPDFTGIRCSLYATTNAKTLDGACKLVVGDKTIECADAKALDDALKNVSSWVPDKTGYYTTLVLETEADYSFSLLATDVMGNVSNRVNYFVTLDKTAPSFSSVDIDATQDKNKTDYTRFSNKKITFSFEFKEKVTTVTQVSCVYVDSDTNTAYTVQASDIKQSKDKVTGTVTISNTFKGNVKLIAKDQAGHETTYSIKGGMILEGKKKHIESSDATITVLGTKNAEGFYSEDVYMNLKASDSYSGIKKIVYTINDDKFSEEIEDKTLQYTWNKNRVKIAADKYEGKDIAVTLEIEDNAGNVSTVEETIKLDTTKPQISVSYDNNNALNGTYYNQSRTATIIIKEYNFNNADVVLTATRDGEALELKPDFKLDKKAYTEDGTLYKDYKMTVPFMDDGDYTFTLSYTDLAGNKANYSTVNEFIVDKTSPAVELTFNYNEPAAGAYFKDGRTGTITVTEHNFDAASMAIEVHRTLNGVASSAPAPANFRSAGDKHVTSIAFSEEGVYTISVTGRDMAGNEANSIEEQQFTIDVTAPEVEIEGLEAGVSYTGNVAPVVTVTDNNYNSEGVNIDLTAGKQKTIKAKYETAPAVRGEVFRFATFDTDEGADDIYDLTVTARDLAGHETVENVGFKINRHGSYYIVPELSKQMIDNYYISGDTDFEIYEYNVDGLQEHSVYYSLNGDITQLVKGVDYTVQEEIDRDTEWSKYTYKINSEVFVQEGVYLLSISSKDESGNVTDNKVKGLELEFCVDKTAPSCVVTGIENDYEFEKDATRQITVDVFDNIEFVYLEMFIDNKSVKRAEAADLDGGKLTYTIPQDGGNHVLQIFCYDAAGNQSSSTFTYHVSGGIGSQQAKMIVGIVFAVATMSIFILFIITKRKKREQ